MGRKYETFIRLRNTFISGVLPIWGGFETSDDLGPTF